MIYHSNLTAPDLAPHFHGTICEPRHWSMGHDAISDRDFEPNCTFMTHDEVAILYAVGKQVGGTWVDIGSRFGWTSAHLAVAGCRVLAVDPGYQDAGFAERMRENTYRVYDSDPTKLCTQLIPETSQDFFDSQPPSKLFDGVCIDGNHDAPYPQRDAAMAWAHLDEQGVIVFHDFWGKPIRDGVDYLLDIGFEARVYDTPNGMAVCWKGSFDPPDHEPDPAIDWVNVRKSRARDFDFSRVS
jgi:hypothetical protein